MSGNHELFLGLTTFKNDRAGVRRDDGDRRFVCFLIQCRTKPPQSVRDHPHDRRRVFTDSAGKHYSINSTEGRCERSGVASNLKCEDLKRVGGLARIGCEQDRHIPRNA